MSGQPSLALLVTSTIDSNDSTDTSCIETPTTLSPSPIKRLRSCLSPTRLSPTPERQGPSRADSFSSDSSLGLDDSAFGGWRRTKSVRWEGEVDDASSAVTSYFSTWSASEYDRTPLDPPSEAERTCVLPERGSRCFRSSLICDRPPSGLQSDLPDGYNPSSIDYCESPIDDGNLCSDALVVLTAESTDQEESTEDDQREWEECMERRRMMFAMRQCGGGGEDASGVRCPEFEGYRSISASLVEMLKSVGIGAHGSSTPPIIEEDESEVMAATQEDALDLGASVFERLRKGGEDGKEGDGVETPSLVSSEESEGDSCLLGSPVVNVIQDNKEGLELRKAEGVLTLASASAIDNVPL